MSIRTNASLSKIVLLLRYLIGVAFVPSGLTKILGERFTTLTSDTPIGLFFEGLYQTGFYWKFLGISQLLAALLLMTQRFATIGNCIFLFIIMNIWVITLSLQFQGTWIITSLLLFASLCLLLWDSNKLEFLLMRDTLSFRSSHITLPTYSSVWIVNGVLLFVLSVSVSLFSYYFPSHAKTAILVYVILVLMIVSLTLMIDRRTQRTS